MENKLLLLDDFTREVKEVIEELEKESGASKDDMAMVLFTGALSYLIDLSVTPAERDSLRTVFINILNNINKRKANEKP